jgi:hypothetical protein
MLVIELSGIRSFFTRNLAEPRPTKKDRAMGRSIELKREREPPAAVDSEGANRGAETATRVGQERTILKRSICFGVAAALLATAAFAQPPQPPSGPRPLAPGATPSPPPQPGGPTTIGQAPQPPAGGPRSEAPPPPSKAAHFRVEQGDNGVDVKCADEEPMRACADITMQFLDRLGISQPRTTGSAPAQR